MWATQTCRCSSRSKCLHSNWPTKGQQGYRLFPINWLTNKLKQTSKQLILQSLWLFFFKGSGNDSNISANFHLELSFVNIMSHFLCLTLGLACSECSVSSVCTIDQLLVSMAEQTVSQGQVTQYLCTCKCLVSIESCHIKCMPHSCYLFKHAKRNTSQESFLLVAYPPFFSYLSLALFLRSLLLLFFLLVTLAIKKDIYSCSVQISVCPSH